MQFTTGMIALAAALFSATSASPIVDIDAEPVSAPELVERQSAHISYTSDADFKRTMLGGHDAYRRQHGISTAMTWNAERAAAAAAYAKTCNFAHTGTKGVGENLAIGYSDAAKVITAWSLERKQYDFNNPGFSSATGHFTQVVWKGTGSIGCGRASCGSRGYIVVCQYVKQGNILPASNFKTNVLKQTRGLITDSYYYRPAKKVRRDAEADVEAEAEPEMKVKRNANAEEDVPLVAPIKIAGEDDE